MRPRPPELYCLKCHKAIDGKGYYGPGCMCDKPKRDKPLLGHSIGGNRNPVSRA